MVEATLTPTQPFGPCSRRPGTTPCPSTPSSGQSSGAPASWTGSTTSRSPTRGMPPDLAAALRAAARLPGPRPAEGGPGAHQHQPQQGRPHRPPSQLGVGRHPGPLPAQPRRRGGDPELHRRHRGPGRRRCRRGALSTRDRARRVPGYRAVPTRRADREGGGTAAGRRHSTGLDDGLRRPLLGYLPPGHQPVPRGRKPRRPACVKPRMRCRF